VTEQKVVLSGMRSTGKIHLGNYFGALKNWVELQDSYRCLYFAADWHALTSDYADPSQVADSTIEMVTDWIAAGLDPARSILFIQSLVPQHAELHLLLSMLTPLGWLERVPTYKEQIQQLENKDLTTYGEEESPAGERLASESMLIDAASGRVLGDLRSFSVSSTAGQPIVAPVDISSVAFADGDRFFATLSTPDRRYLVSGSVIGRRLEVIGSGLANEAVSPDGKQLLVKKQTGERGFWQLVVLDLDSRREVALNQGPRSVDDQVEWLDAGHVVYHDVTEDGTGIWMLPTDGTTAPRLLVADAFSPAVQR